MIGGLEIFGQQEWVADDVDPLADAAGVAVAEFGGWEIRLCRAA